MEQSNKYKNLAKNTLVFGIGTFGSRVLQFLIIPLYTYVLTTEEYGKIDLFATTISLALPVVTLLIQESIIRFLTTKEISRKNAISIGFCVFFISIIISCIASILYYIFFDAEYTRIFFLCLILNSFVAIFQNYLKANGEIVKFTICGLINTFSFLGLNFFMLVILRMGIIGYFYSIAVSQVISAIYVVVSGKIFSQLSFKKAEFKYLPDMLKFCIPLIPNNLMWWIMNAGDKYIINYFLGDSANGIYSMSIKLATIITTIFGIFMQAWQLSAIEENGNSDQGKFYSQVYSLTVALLLLCTSCVFIITRPLYGVIINESFYEASLYSPLLCVATVLNCMSTFAGVTYLVNKSTKKAFSTTLIGAIVNVIANFVLIRYIGLVGVAIGTICGYIVVVIIRLKDTRKSIGMDLDILRTLFSFIIVLASAIAYLWLNDFYVYVVGISSFIVVGIIYRIECIAIIKTIIQRLRKVRRG